MGTHRLAQCYEGLGKTASSWANYLEVADLARAAGQADREKAARERAKVMESRLARLTLVVTTPDLPGLEVRRGGVVIGKAQWGSPVPVDPASYEIQVSAPGKTPWAGSVTVEGDGANATLTVPSLEDGPAPPPEPAPSPPLPQAAPPSPLPALSVIPALPSSVQSPLPTVGLVVAGVGVAGLTVGTVAGILALVKKGAAETECASPQCPSDAADKWHDAAVTGNVATVALAVGGVALAGGAVLWLTAPRANASTKLGVGLGRLEVSGAW
jgi:hypothetical protein